MTLGCKNCVLDPMRLTAPLEGGGASLTTCWDCCEGAAVEMILSPTPAAAPPPPLPAVVALAVAVEEAAVVVARGAGELVATDEEEDTGKRSGRSSSISWLCVST